MITSSEIDDLLYHPTAGADGKFLSQEYSLPDWDWVLKEFSERFRKENFDKGLSDYRLQCNMCGQWALRAKVLMNDIQGSALQGTRLGMAFGMFAYTPDPESNFHGVTPDGRPMGHARNVCIVNVAGQRIIKFYEPQEYGEPTYKMTSSELQSIDWYLF